MLTFRQQQLLTFAHSYPRQSLVRVTLPVAQNASSLLHAQPLREIQSDELTYSPGEGRIVEGIRGQVVVHVGHLAGGHKNCFGESKHLLSLLVLKVL